MPAALPAAVLVVAVLALALGAVIVAGVRALVRDVAASPPVPKRPPAPFPAAAGGGSALARFNRGGMTPGEFLALGDTEPPGYGQRATTRLHVVRP